MSNDQLKKNDGEKANVRIIKKGLMINANILALKIFQKTIKR